MKVAKPIPASQLADAIVKALPGKVSEFAPKLGRKRTDSTIRNRLKQLEEAGEIRCDRGVWSRIETDPISETLKGYEFPPDFDDESRDQFDLKTQELLDADVNLDSFAIELVENYVRCLQRAREANAEVQNDAMFQSAAKGDRKFAHPGIAIAREAERDAHVYREAIEKRKRKDPDANPDEDPTAI